MAYAFLVRGFRSQFLALKKCAKVVKKVGKSFILCYNLFIMLKGIIVLN